VPACISFFLIQRSHYTGDGTSADPMRRAFIRNGEAPASGTRARPLRIPAISNRTGPRNHDHARTRAEGRVQRDFHISHDFNFTRN